MFSNSFVHSFPMSSSDPLASVLPVLEAPLTALRTYAKERNLGARAQTHGSASHLRVAIVNDIFKKASYCPPPQGTCASLRTFAESFLAKTTEAREVAKRRMTENQSIIDASNAENVVFVHNLAESSAEVTPLTPCRPCRGSVATAFADAGVWGAPPPIGDECRRHQHPPSNARR